VREPQFFKYNEKWISAAGIRRMGRFSLDVSLSGLCFLLAMRLRLGWPGVLEDSHSLYVNLLFFCGISAAVFWITGFPFPSWRFASTPDLFAAVRAIMIVVTTYAALGTPIAGLTSVPPSVPVIACFIMITTLGGVRVLYRTLVGLPFSLKDLLRPNLSHMKPVYLLAYGANAETDAFLRALDCQALRSYQIVGIIDDDPASRDRHIRGVKVLGSMQDLPQIVTSCTESSICLSRLILPANKIPRKKLVEIVEKASSNGLRAVRLPTTWELLQKANEPFPFEPIDVTNLLSRAPVVALHLDSISTLIRGKSVVVTGGGGSIGSELCRKILARGPAKLVIIDHCEFNLFSIEKELVAEDREGVVKPVLASIRDRGRIEAIFKESQADLVFHAAAYKHVPIVESNPIEGILTNVIGTSNVADSAGAIGALAMIMISTDKAVKPTNIMGLTKRIAETYCQAMDLDFANRGQATRFLTVRFGNVLGSSGSVVPIFEQQIKGGGPVTVTDPAMTRYFMTIPEAVELSLQGAIFGLDCQVVPRGSILVLDMGEPVPIVQIARRMITLAGFAQKDIEIQFVGARDGEKLQEELFDDNEMRQTTNMPGILLARSKVRSLHRMHYLRACILQSSLSGDAQPSIAMMREFLAETLDPATCQA
jgi:FlaA1/EpsC-like NDP-sugar epimerase